MLRSRLNYVYQLAHLIRKWVALKPIHALVVSHPRSRTVKDLVVLCLSLRLELDSII